MRNGLNLFMQESALGTSLSFENVKLDKAKMLSFFKNEDEVFLFSFPEGQMPYINQNFKDEKFVLTTNDSIAHAPFDGQPRSCWFKAITMEETKQCLALAWDFEVAVITKPFLEKIERKEVDHIDYRFCINCAEECCNHIFSYKEKTEGDFKQNVYPNLREWMEKL